MLGMGHGDRATQPRGGKITLFGGEGMGWLSFASHVIFLCLCLPGQRYTEGWTVQIRGPGYGMGSRSSEGTWRDEMMKAWMTKWNGVFWLDWQCLCIACRG
jgi:hypothetical protein